MPTSSTFCGRLLGIALLAAIWATAGCRVFRSQQVSDENISEARRLSLQGLDAQQRGQWERAETLFAAAILKCPSDERARYGYAESLWQRGAWQQALSHMEEAVRLSGSDPERLVRLGQMYWLGAIFREPRDRPTWRLPPTRSSSRPGPCAVRYCKPKATAAPH